MTPLCAQVRAFARVLKRNSTNGDHRRQGQELNQSPLLFMEATQLSESQRSVARKDEIIRVRNAQVHNPPLNLKYTAAPTAPLPSAPFQTDVERYCSQILLTHSMTEVTPLPALLQILLQPSVAHCCLYAKFAYAVNLRCRNMEYPHLLTAMIVSLDSSTKASITSLMVQANTH